MKEGWKYGFLKDIASVIHGKNQKAVESQTGKYPIYGSGGSIMGYANDYLCEEGTTILGRKGTINNPIYIPTKFWNVDTAFGIVANKDFDKRFLFYFIKSQDWSKKNTGTTLPSLTQAVVLNTPISYPALSEQQRIVDYLDKTFAEIDALKAKAEQSLQNAKDLFQAALKEEMTPKEGWAKKTLNEIGNSKVGPFGSLLHKSDYVIGGIPLINPMHIVNGCIKADMNFSINNEKYKELQAFVMNEGDIVIARRGEMGRCAVVNSEHSGYLCGTGSIFFRPNSSLVDPVFLQLLISSENTKKEIVKIAGGATMLNLSSKGLNNLKVRIPKIEIQRSIVAKLDALRSLISELEQKYTKITAECDALKQAILRETFE